MKKVINIANDFSPVVRNRNEKQTDGKFTGIEFRKKFLASEIDTPEWWKDNSKSITIDFEDVDTLGPSWVNEVFAYFTKYNVDYQTISKKFNFVGLDEVWIEILQTEIEQGYRG